VTDVRTDVAVTVRYFAAARAAAGTEEEVVTLPPGTSVATLLAILAQRNAEVARVLERCSYLWDGIAVRDQGTLLDAEHTLDVLPPFAGG
jgi:sulfur-carrier protein